MINKEEAFIIAEKYLRVIESMDNDYMALRLMKESTIETDFGWVFFYNSKEFLESGNMSYCLIGNSPFIVDNLDGSVHNTGTAHPVGFYIECYREKRSDVEKK